MAISADEEGLLVGFVFGEPIRLRWDELAEVRCSYLFDSKMLVVIPRKRLTLARRLAPLDLVSYCIAGGRFVVPLAILGRPWFAIEEALRPKVKTRTPHRAQIHPSLQPAKRAPRTLEEHRLQFRRAPVGSWSNSVDGPSPGDCEVSFHADGTGRSSSGTAIVFGASYGFLWREREEDFAVDCRGTYEGAKWQKIGYEFIEEEGEITINFRFYFDDEEDDQDDHPVDEDDDRDEWIGGFFGIGGGMTFSGKW